MNPNIDDMTGVERPRMRRFMSIIAILVPVIVLAGASAWFIRAYVMPPMIGIPESAMASPTDSTPAQQATPVALTAASPPETTGTAAPPPEPAYRLTTDTAAIWASVPLPGPPRSGWNSPAQPSVAAGEPATIPMPPQRPRISVGTNDGPVPLPRPRPTPTLASN